MQPEKHKGGLERGMATEALGNLARAQVKVSQVHAARCASAIDRFVEAAEGAGSAFRAGGPTSPAPLQVWQDATEYAVDFLQRSILFWDTLRQRGNNWIEHEKAGKPPVLAFDYEMLADARSFERPANYALVRIVPPQGVDDRPEATRPS